MSGLKAVLCKLTPARNTLSIASVWKSLSKKTKVTKSAVLTTVSDTSPSVVPSVSSSAAISSMSDASVNSSSKACSKIGKGRKISKEDHCKIQSYLEGAVRPSSRKTYASYWNRYKSFCLEKKFELNSAEAISLFLIKLAESSENKSAALSAKAAIKFHLKVANYSKKCSTDSFLVGRIAKSIAKKYSKPVKKAKTISSKEVRDMVELLLSNGSFKDERTANFFLIQFLLMARFEEVANLKKENVVILDSGDLEIKIVEAKNYGSWDSQKSYIAKGTSTFDPVQLIKTSALPLRSLLRDQGLLRDLLVKIGLFLVSFYSQSLPSIIKI